MEDDLALDVDGELDGVDCLFCFFKESGSWYGALELTYGPVAVKRVASAAERDMIDSMPGDNKRVPIGDVNN